MGEDAEKDPGFTVRKKVDESWKNSIQKEKEKLATPETESNAAFSEPDFSLFLSTLGMQALMALGESPDPSTGQKRTDLVQAQYLIDVIQMLSEKTKGNLSPEEAQMLKDLLYDLQMKFVKKSQEP